ncbi:MAG TPA: triose-phosphate isomerase [Myxococcota bacterium]|nr:triose-phosphate isomerase [Myxococcota bacterium]
MRTPFVTANWKMHKTAAEAVAFARALAPRVAKLDGVEIAVAPPFTALGALADALAGSGVALAAQNVHFEKSGAFTGEVSVAMLAELGCRYVILGHSERRQLFGESDEIVARKVRAVQAAGLRPILCVGELLVEREAGRTFDVLRRQLAGSLAEADPARADELVIAYEPVWAIGTGRTATPEIAQEAHAYIRARLADRFGARAGRIRLQYGGSVKAENCDELLAQPDIDGALVGGASLDPEAFSAIIRSRARGAEMAS